MSQNINLVSLFGTVTKALEQNQAALDQADEINQDHGTNMVQTFQTITKALQAKQGQPTSTALAYASKQLSKKTASGSGQLYAQGLNRAAAQFKGKEMDTRGAMQLLQALIGGGQSSPAGSGDMLGTLLGGMNSQGQPGSSAGSAEDLLGALLGGQTSQQSSQAAGGDLLSTLLGGMASGGEQQPQGDLNPQSSGQGDMLGSLLGGLMGGESAPASSSQNAGLDMGDLLNVGMSLLGGGQNSSNPLGALVQAFTSGSGMGKTTHRDQSTSLVVNTFLQALTALSKR